VKEVGITIICSITVSFVSQFCKIQLRQILVMWCSECPVPFAVVFRDPEIVEFKKSPSEETDAITLAVLNAR